MFPPNASLGLPQLLNFVDRLESNFSASDSINYAFSGARTDGSNVGNPAGPGFVQEIGLVQALNQTFGPNDLIAMSIGGNNANSILAGTVVLGPDPVAGATE